MSFLFGAIGPRANNFLQKMMHDHNMLIPFEQGFVIVGPETSETKRILLNNQGILIGTLFDRATSKPVQLNNQEINNIIQDPSILSKNYWGSYCGIIYNAQQQTHTLIRDPIGLSTIFYLKYQDNILFSTDIALLYDLLETKPAINFDYFADYLINQNHALSSTPFQGINELLPGTMLIVDNQISYKLKQYWDISNFHGSFIQNENDLEEELLATMQSCLKALTYNSSGVCVELSGGVDSSSIMILLRNILKDKKLVAVNYIDSKSPSSNEIEYAQEVADACNAPLYFLDWQKSSFLERLPNIRPNKPSTLLLHTSLSAQLDELAQQHGNLTIMNGQGGDHVFLAPQPQGALADYILDRGLFGITKPMQELLNVYRMPWWSLTKATTKDLLYYYTKKKTLSNETPFFTQDFVKRLNPEQFFLASTLNNFYPGKAMHLESITHAITYAERNQRPMRQTIIHPLLSQPIVELGLKIPTYQSFRNGYDRIFFRQAVSRIQQPKALWRTIKGDTTSSMIKSFIEHIDEIYDLTTQGRLVREGIINIEWINEQLIKARHGHQENLWPLIQLLTSELWFKQWNLS